MKKPSFTYLILLLFFLLSGCNQVDIGSDAENDTIRPAKMNTSESQQEDLNQQDAEKVKDILLKKDQVKLVRSVQSKDLLIAAVEFEHWNTFKSKTLTKEMKKTLEKEFQIKTVEVTSDHKIFIELEKLEEKIRADDISKKKLDKELQKINKLMKEQT